MDEDLKNLTKLPWASIPELAGFRYVNRTTVSRKEEVWNRDGLFVVKYGGLLVRPRPRLLSTTGGLIEVFPQQHVHLGLDHDDHEHNPLHPAREDHEHPGFFNGYNGALDLWEKLERLEMWYPAAPEVLLGEGAAWTHDGEARRILSWRWLRNSRFIEAVATYEDDYYVFFGHIGRSVTKGCCSTGGNCGFQMFTTSGSTRWSCGPAANGRSGCATPCSTRWTLTWTTTPSHRHMSFRRPICAGSSWPVGSCQETRRISTSWDRRPVNASTWAWRSPPLMTTSPTNSKP